MKFLPMTLAVIVAAMSFALLPTVAQNIKWNCLSRTGALFTSSPLLGSDGTLYVGIGVSLFAIDTVGSNSVSECMVKWLFQTKGVIQTTPILGPDGTLYFVSNDLHIYALDTLSNQTEAALRQKWNFPLYIKDPPGGEMRSSPVLGLDGSLYVGSNDAKIYAFDTVVSNSVSKGTVKWVSNKTTGAIQTTPILGPDGTLYFGDNGNNFHAYETMGTAAGTLKWSCPAEGKAFKSSPVLGPDGTLFIGSNDNSLYAIDTVGVSSCKVKWRFRTSTKGLNSPGSVQTTPILGSDGTLYFAADDGFIYALDTLGNKTDAASRLKWRLQRTAGLEPPYTSKDAQSSPVLGLNGTLYIGYTDGFIYAIGTVGNQTDAAPKWTLSIGTSVQSSPLLGPDGTLYVGSNNNIYALGTGINCTCGAGTFQNSSAFFSSCTAIAAVCSPCPRSSFCPCLRQCTTPVPCPVGFFCDMSGKTAPTPCPAGTYNSAPRAANASACLQCPVGTTCFPQGRAAPTLCPSGSFCASTQTAPTPCPVGTYNDATQATTVNACLPCPSGSFCTEGQTSPSSCPIGHYCPSSGMNSSLPCLPGTYCPLRGMNTSTPCAAGFYCPSDGNTDQKKCDAGSYCPRSFMTEPLTCNAGNYCPEGSSAEIPCAAGFYQPSQGASMKGQCQPCLAGNYCPKGSIRCFPCPAGTSHSFYNATQKSDCSPCRPNTFAPAGAFECTDCGQDQTSGSGASTCYTCVPSILTLKGFGCYSSEARVFVAFSFILSMLSFLFTIYRISIWIRERFQRLKDANIKPTLKRAVFLNRTLANFAKHRELRTVPDGPNPTDDNAVVGLMRDFQLQIQEQLQERNQHQLELKQFEERLMQQQLQQQQQQLEMKQFEERLIQQQQAVQEQVRQLHMRMNHQPHQES